MKLSKIIKGFNKSQNGHVFITALIILALGSAMLAPLLGFIGTGLKTGQAFEEQTDLLYAADAGIEDAIWQINNYGAGIIDETPGTYSGESYVLGEGTASGLPPYLIYEEENADPIEFFDEDGHLIEIYDSSSNKIDIFDYEGNQITLFDIYDQDGNLIDVYDANGNLITEGIFIYINEQQTKVVGVYDTVFYSLQKNDVPKINGCDVNVKVTRVEGDVFFITSEAIDEKNNVTVIESFITNRSNLNVFAGAIVCQGDITLKKEIEVYGDIYYGGKLIGEPDLITGVDEYRQDLELPTEQENLAFLSPYIAEALAGTEEDYSTGPFEIPRGTTRDFGPLYIDGDLNIWQNCEINLIGTIFVDGNIVIKQGATIKGNGNIIATGDITLMQVADYGIDGTSIIMSLNGDISFKQDATLTALIYAPNGSVNISTDDDGAIITGSIVCASIDSDVYLNKKIKIVYDPNIYHNLDLPGSSRISLNYVSWLIK
ncbi:MAG: hypothetical protein RBS96_01885 [Dehalococcoidales bacterium]|jgi:hypothetical protein|nr:hypothetical protein [Dehalococcoidales bacterium]